MKNIKLTLLLTFSAFVILSCATTKNLEKEYKIYITNTKKIGLMSPEYMLEDIDDMVSLSGSFGKDNFTLLSYLQADNTGIFLTLLNDFGTDMGTLTYDGIEVVLDSALFPSNLKCEYIICDFQLAFYSPEAVKEHLQNSGLYFDCISTDNQQERYITDGKKIIYQIQKTGNKATIINKLRNYSYNLTFDTGL